jgi:hypothetical protein
MPLVLSKLITNIIFSVYRTPLTLGLYIFRLANKQASKQNTPLLACLLACWPQNHVCLLACLLIACQDSTELEVL